MEITEGLSQYQDLYLFEQGEYSTIFRCLNWNEYKIFRYLFEAYPAIQVSLEDQLWELCVIEHNFPAGIDYIEAGVVTNVARLVIYFSGRSLNSGQSINLLQQDLSIARQKRDSLEGQIKLAILEAFPSYKLHELDGLSWTKIVELLAYSEYLLKKNFEFNLTDETKDDSNKVFDMLNEYSSGANINILEPEIEETMIRKGRIPPTKPNANR